MEKKSFANFDEFWPYYLAQHSHSSTKLCHFAGLASAFTLVAVSVVTLNYGLLVFAVLAGYGWAFFGHYYFEKNRPATFQYPLYSFFADFKMFAAMLQGKVK